MPLPELEQWIVVAARAAGKGFRTRYDLVEHPSTEELVLDLVAEIPGMSIQTEDPRFRPDLEFEYEVRRQSLTVFLYRRAQDPPSMVRLETRQSMDNEDCWGEWGVGNDERQRQIEVFRHAVYAAGIEVSHDFVNNSQWMILTQRIAIGED